MATITGTTGNDTLTGTSKADTINISQGGNDTVQADSGDDIIIAGASLTAADSIDGGKGTDTLTLSGDYAAGLVLSATTLTNVERIQLGAGFSYSLTTNDANVGKGQSSALNIDGSALGSANSLTVNGSAETDGA